MDYDTVIDAEVWAFIKETERYYPTDTIDQSIEVQRDVYNTMCRAFFAGYPDGISAADSIAGSVPIRVYSKGDAETTVIYFHGGGFVVGGLDSHDDVCAEICDQTGFRVVSADYRLAPEFKHPAMFDDAMTATQHVLAECDGPVLLCGDSAGGNLVAAVSHAMRGLTDRIKGQVLIYPFLGADMDKGSYLTHANAPLLNLAELDFYTKVRSPNGPLPRDATFTPLKDTDFTGLPPTFVVAAQCDPLCDDGEDYCNAIRAAGGKAECVIEPGLIHGYLRARTTSKRAKASFDRCVNALTKMGIG